MRKAFFIYNISELTRNRGIRNLGSGWQEEKKKGRCMLVGQSRDIAEEEYLELENELQWDGDEVKRRTNQGKVHSSRLGSGRINGVGASVPGLCF